MTDGQLWLAFGLIGLCIVSVYAGIVVTAAFFRDGVERYFRW